MYLSAEPWLDNARSPDDVLLDNDAIAALARTSFANDPNMVNLATFAEQLPGADVAKLIQSISKPYETELFYRDGGIVETAV